MGSTVLVPLKPAKPLVDCAASVPRLPLACPGCLPEVVILPTLLTVVFHIRFQHCLERSEIQPANVGCLLARACVHVGRDVNCLPLSLFTEQLQVAIAVLGSAPFKWYFFFSYYFTSSRIFRVCFQYIFFSSQPRVTGSIFGGRFFRGTTCSANRNKTVDLSLHRQFYLWVLFSL